MMSLNSIIRQTTKALLITPRSSRDAVVFYVKNTSLGFAIPIVAADGKEQQYFPDFIAHVSAPDTRTACPS